MKHENIFFMSVKFSLFTSITFYVYNSLLSISFFGSHCYVQNIITTDQTARTVMCYVPCVMSYVLCAMSYVLCAMSYVLCAVSYVLCAMSYVLCAMSYVLCAVCHVLHAMCHVLRSMCRVSCPTCYAFSEGRHCSVVA